MKPTKASLLASLLSLLLCVSMLVGTTMAWFTDTTSTNVVKIVAGNFDVPILELAAGGNTSKDLQAKDGSSTLLWTSGATHELKPFRIKNTGTVAMTYKIRIAGVTGGNAALLDVIDFSVAVGGGALQPLGEAVAELEAGAVTPSITLTGTMQATAGEEYQNQTFDGIKIILSAEEKGAEQNTTSVMENGREFTSGTHVLTTGVTATAAGADALRVFGSETQVIIQSGAFDGGSGGPNTCIWAKDGATVRIEGGTFTVGDDANSEGNSVIYATTGAKVIISGGFFYTNTPYNGFYYVLNQKNDAPGTFEVTGGTFVNFDPSKGDDNLGGNFVKDGYKVVSETKENGEVWYTVEESSTPSLPTVATLSDEDFS